jgi:DNA-binding NarL/FixJ family response regulator
MTMIAAFEDSRDSRRHRPTGDSLGTRSVLVVEDDANTRNYIAHALESDHGGFSVETAGSLATAFDSLRRDPPDVLLVDLGLPDGNGTELIRFARDLSTEIHVLVITVFGDEASVIGAIEAGAQGYLLKSEAPDDVRLCVAQVLAGGAPISPGIASHLLRRFSELHPLRASHRSEGPALTPRECEVLQLIVQGVPYQEAAGVLGITRNTVASHVKSIYRKLEVGSRGEAVFEALSRGIVKVEPDA